jgi:DNA polymerase-3 subunit delta
MIRTLTGKNSYKLHAYLQERVDEVLAVAGELAIERLDASEVSIDTLLQSVQSLPFLVDRKLIIITNVQSNTVLLERLPEVIDRTAESVEVLLVDPSFDKRKAAYKVLQKQTELHDFPEPQPRELPAWLVAEAKEVGASLSLSDAQYLVDRVGAHQQLLASELQKLCIYDPKITRATIELLTEQSLQSTIFSLLDAAFAGDMKKAVEMYREQRKARIEPHYILAMLVWQLQSLALAVYTPDASEGSLVATGMSPFTARKVAQLARGKTKADIKRMVVTLTELDAQIKTSADADAGVELYLMSL